MELGFITTKEVELYRDALDRIHDVWPKHKYIKDEIQQDLQITMLTKGVEVKRIMGFYRRLPRLRKYNVVLELETCKVCNTKEGRILLLQGRESHPSMKEPHKVICMTAI